MSKKWERRQQRHRVLAIFVTIGFHLGLLAVVGGNLDLSSVKEWPQDLQEWWNGEEAPAQEVSEETEQEQA